MHKTSAFSISHVFFLDVSNNAATRYATHVTRTRFIFALESFKASINSWYLLVSLLRRDIWNILRSGESSLAMFCLVMVAWWDFVVLARNLCHHLVTDRENNKLREQQSWISISCIDRDVVRQLPCLFRVDALVLEHPLMSFVPKGKGRNEEARGTETVNQN